MPAENLVREPVEGLDIHCQLARLTLEALFLLRRLLGVRLWLLAEDLGLSLDQLLLPLAFMSMKCRKDRATASILGLAVPCKTGDVIQLCTG
jgi:hypothetical protein